MTNLDLFGNEGEKLRNEGILRVTISHLPWMQQATILLPYVLRGKTLITGEEIRFAMIDLGLPEPRSPNAWGAVTIQGARMHRLVNTGRTVKTKFPSSHARRTMVWQVV